MKISFIFSLPLLHLRFLETILLYTQIRFKTSSIALHVLLLPVKILNENFNSAEAFTLTHFSTTFNLIKYEIGNVDLTWILHKSPINMNHETHNVRRGLWLMATKFYKHLVFQLTRTARSSAWNIWTRNGGRKVNVAIFHIFVLKSKKNLCYINLRSTVLLILFFLQKFLYAEFLEYV